MSTCTAELDFGVTRDKLDAYLDRILPFEVAEQRWSVLIQAVLVIACLAITPLLRYIPEAVLWGYFAYMGIASLPGSQFRDRLVLLFVEPRRRGRAAAEWGHSYYEGVPFRQAIGAMARTQP